MVILRLWNLATFLLDKQDFYFLYKIFSTSKIYVQSAVKFWLSLWKNESLWLRTTCITNKNIMLHCVILQLYVRAWTIRLPAEPLHASRLKKAQAVGQKLIKKAWKP